MPYITWNSYLTNQNSLGSEPKSNAFETGLGEVTINQDHPWLEGQVWRKGVGGNELAAERGRNDHGSSCGAEMLLNGPQLQWDTKHMTDASLENALLHRACDYPSSPECWREYVTRIPKASRLSTYILSCCRHPDVYTYICLSYSETDMLTRILTVMHPPKHIHTCTCNKTKKEISPPPKHSYSHKSVPLLQATPWSSLQLCTV